MMMTPEIAREWVAEIEGASGDPERAHSLEDQFRFLVLTAIGGGSCEDPKECAVIAASTELLEFDRWCA